MSIFKKALKQQLRFKTPKGSLSAEQLWLLTKEDLAQSIKMVKKELDKTSGDDDLSFLGERNTVDKKTQLRFDILKEVYLDIRKDEEEARERILNKQHNEKIKELIAEKQEEGLKDKSVEELEALLK